MTLYNAIILIKSNFNEDMNHYYYKIFLEKCSYQLAKNNHNFHSIIMLTFGEKQIAKEKLYAAKKTYEIWDVNVNNIIISKIVKTKN